MNQRCEAFTSKSKCYLRLNEVQMVESNNIIIIHWAIHVRSNNIHYASMQKYLLSGYYVLIDIDLSIQRCSSL